MATYFHFLKDDEYIKERLSKEEIEAVKKWQSPKLDYEFSFHTQHEAGWPLYIIEPGQRGKRNRPKINLKVPTYEILEGKNLINAAVGKDAKDVARNNIGVLQQLAEEYYEPKEEEVEEPRQLVAKVAVWKCKSAQCKGRVITQTVDENEAGQLQADNDAYMQAWIKDLPKCKRCKKVNWEFTEVKNLGIAEEADLSAGQEVKQI